MNTIMFWVVFVMCMYGALSSFLKYRNSKSKRKLGWYIARLELCAMHIIVEHI